MSTNLAYAQPQPLHRPSGRPSHIEIVTTTKAQRKARPRMLYAVVTVASFFVILAAQLLLSIVVTQGAYQIDSLQYEQKVLIRTEQSLLESLSLQSSSQNLAAQAAGFGMVPNATPYSLDITDGSVFRLPGSADPTGCGGSCGLVGNTLLSGVPLVSAEAAAAAEAAAKTATTTAATVGAATSGTAAAAAETAAPEPANNAIPAPVTR
ncbi:hypothetical protein CLV85_1703 [Salinibacterium amurskyense]|uniref:Cell division protein FtsL n=1 Tax=Salinibacterium amurskyense TaxID=205941 RepID=A0A2M9D9Z8_9MICO|nr:hypothetical protein [Salinibacterium amurskyense]PJJ82502.1 hypothetical protein CLV85_1703 [Salinibacterium amurskyense]RLQ82246.1 hypothetical protein D9C83_08470 [Salinibacterium amurskyense]GHD76714.1 hypothetical protein GCM10007394_01280 [Salinibacterium amurskyense]